MITRNGSFTICAAFSSAAEIRCSTFDGFFSRAGVAVNSTMHEGKTSPSVEKDRSVRALCASSTITIGRRNRSMFTSDGLGLPSGQAQVVQAIQRYVQQVFCKGAVLVIDLRPVVSSTRKDWIVDTITTV